MGSQSHWDGMDRWDGCPNHGTVVQSHGIPLVPHGTVGRDGQAGWLSQPWDGGTIPWDPTSPTWYSGTGWTGGIAVPAMVQSHGIPLVPHGTVVQSHGMTLVPHGTVGRDGQAGWLSQPWDGGTIPWDPTSPTWYNGTGWTGGMAVPAMGRWYNPMGSH